MEVAANTSGAATCKPALSRSRGHSDDFFLRIFLARPRAVEQRGADARRCCRGDCLGPFVDFLQARCTPLRHGNLHASVMGKDCEISGWNRRSVNPRASCLASIIGGVTIGVRSCIGTHAFTRGDFGAIAIGDSCNVHATAQCVCSMAGVGTGVLPARRRRSFNSRSKASAQYVDLARGRPRRSGLGRQARTPRGSWQ